MKFITIIPARGGSKRFPHKNISPLGSEPLISHSIAYSINNAEISETYVSTDSNDIKNVSIEYGAKVLERPEELSGDLVPTADVLKYCAEVLINQNVKFDFIVLLQATNPLRPKELLEDAIQILKTGNYDSLMSVSRSLRKFGKIINNTYVPWNYEFGMRSQDLEPLYYENGLLYITSKEQILKGKILGDKMFPLIVDHIFGEIDIDTKEDMNYAEYIYQKYNSI